jgi:predicted PurR-regulated permease PerM
MREGARPSVAWPAREEPLRPTPAPDWSRGASGRGLRSGASTAHRLELHLPTVTILKLLLAALAVWTALTLWPETVFFSISLLFAVALEPVVAYAVRRGMSRGVAVMILTFVLLAAIAAVIGVVFPPLAEQVVEVADNFPNFRARVERRIPEDYPILKMIVEQIFLLPSSPEVAAPLKRPLVWGRAAVSGVVTTFFVLVMTLYLLLDGRRLYAWLLAYVPRQHREKMAATVPEVSDVVYAYVRGQAITSALFAAFCALTLYALRVPGVLPLALLAGICDVIPVVGIVIATVPAALLALTVSPLTAGLVVVLYSVYHTFESYFIVPRIYGTSLRLSTLTVLLALIVGGTLQGMLGAVLILPIVAAYPIIERIWLRGYLAPEVIADHRALEHAADTGSDEAIEAVLQGEKHPGERPTTDLPPGPPPRRDS